MTSDSCLQQDVSDELKWEPSVDAAHIGVAVNNGIVTLTGHVTSFAEKDAAERAAKRLYGVKALANEIEVRISGCHARTDEDVAQACLNAFKSDHRIPDGTIKVIVRDGWVSLEGHAVWQYQKNAAESAVRYLIGVQGVTNNVIVQPCVSPREVKDKIEAAFKRNAEIDAHGVRVEVHDAKVTLHGKVRSWAERDEAQRVAWASPGVRVVDNELVVSV